MDREQVHGVLSFGEGVRILKMAFPRYFRNNPKNMHSGETMTLLEMLEKGYIQCDTCMFQPGKTSDDLQEQAERLAEILHQSSYAGVLRSALDVFSEHQPDLHRMMHGALYYPNLKLYAYVSYLTPKTLLGLMAQSDCEQVAVFTALAKWGHRKYYLLFKRCEPWTKFSQRIKSYDLPFLDP
jgi:hypothetical protein